MIGNLWGSSVFQALDGTTTVHASTDTRGRIVFNDRQFAKLELYTRTMLIYTTNVTSFESLWNCHYNCNSNSPKNGHKTSSKLKFDLGLVGAFPGGADRKHILSDGAPVCATAAQSRLLLRAPAELGRPAHHRSYQLLLQLGPSSVPSEGVLLVGTGPNREQRRQIWIGKVSI